MMSLLELDLVLHFLTYFVWENESQIFKFQVNAD